MAVSMQPSDKSAFKSMHKEKFQLSVHETSAFGSLTHRILVFHVTLRGKNVNIINIEIQYAQEHN